MISSFMLSILLWKKQSSAMVGEDGLLEDPLVLRRLAEVLESLARARPS